ncbi:hypothetical protein [Nocardia sp. NPDC059236]|uniref:hypothetical protein n=1 Tax=Nocardia sp. NPDC059236 TaxID=3346783 RepID=UPI0036755A9D
MSEYILTADYFDQIVERREDGTAKRYAKRRRGDILVDLDEDDIERLTAAGAITEASAAEADDEGPVGTDPNLPFVPYRESPGEDGTTVATPVPDAPTPVPDAPTPVPDAPAPVPAAPAEVPPPPRKTATAVEWQAYGVTRGLSEAEAAGLTRAELIERFGH